MLQPKLIVTIISLICLLNAGLAAQEQETILIDAEEEILVIEDEGVGGQAEEMVIEPDTSGEMIEIDDSSSETGLAGEIQLQADEKELEAAQDTAANQQVSTFDIGIDDVWLEYSSLLDRDQSVNSLQYGYLGFSADWKPDSPWEAKVSARIDGYRQTGTPDWTGIELDYGETYIRFRGDNTRFTVGAQELIWGRIDEIPPSDRLSSVDATRFILDDLQDRRRARPMIRIETFSGESKFDFSYMPTFREAELADVESIWYPIDRDRGEILGIEVPSAMAALMPASTIINDAPDTDHAVGLRYSSSGSGIDYALTVQHGRQTLPYFSYDALSNTFEARYPRSTAVGADAAFEKNGITWRFEAAWLSDVPATTNALNYTEVEGINWAGGIEFFPGDGDSRVNLQLAGNHLLNAGNVVERENVYNFNGSVELPFAEERWRANIRFFFGLDNEDIYINPEIAYLGWEPHEFYVEVHYFDGEEGTLGGFHQDHSLISAGWRAKF